LVWIDTVSGGLLATPLLTTRCTTYVPGRSVTKRGVAVSGAVSDEALPAGTESNAHE
jgi:hypothetical protein